MYFLVLILFTLVGSALVVLTIENLATQVQLTLFTWQTPSLPIGLLILLAFILGAFLLYIVSALSALRDRGERKRLQRRIDELERQITSMTSATASVPSPAQQAPAPTIPMPRMSESPPQG